MNEMQVLHKGMNTTTHRISTIWAQQIDGINTYRWLTDAWGENVIWDWEEGWEAALQKAYKGYGGQHVRVMTLNVPEADIERAFASAYEPAQYIDDQEEGVSTIALLVEKSVEDGEPYYRVVGGCDNWSLGEGGESFLEWVEKSRTASPNLEYRIVRARYRTAAVDASFDIADISA